MVIKFSIHEMLGFENVELELFFKKNKWHLSGFSGRENEIKINKELSASLVDPVLKDFMKIKTSIPPFIIGYDGTFYQLDVKCGFNSISYHWWSFPPKCFKEIISFCDTLLSWAGLGIKISDYC